eukprot:9380178-Alexandrium_andersonii.AAC.1
MSASLVGSEMCIRDSHPDPPNGAPTKLLRPNRRPPPRRPTATTRVLCPCLLYTSDAADDM